ncbi:hypothetical protein EVA_14562 [gut metagenome]|uniref:Uncharacterized protein n=1 Tax=gut metagenome TaxID=749906 RepID=J9CBK3_9ZZZZ
MVDCPNLSAEGFLYAGFESFRLVCHHFLRLFIRISSRIIASCPRIVK